MAKLMLIFVVLNVPEDAYLDNRAYKIVNTLMIDYFDDNLLDENLLEN